MTILSNIGAALFFIAFILLILCIISFFKKNGKAKQYGRPTVILFMISIILITAGTTKSEHPVVEFFSTLSFILFIFFLVLAILSVIKKTGVAKKQFIITAVLFVIFVALSGISDPSSEKTTATSTKVASNNEELKDSEKKKEADEKTQKQEDEKRLADEQARKQEDEKRLADEQARKQQEEQKRLADEQARKQQEEQKRLADEQARKQQEEQKRLADEQARKQQEEQKRLADEQARKQQEEQKAQQAQTQPASGNTSSAYYKNCAAVRAAGKAPLYKGQPGYDSHLDRDGDGVACEK
ncbi:TPA: excalibur calcium-binding domain-containing protein [Bacillus cereus]|uniref:excalibur calcium-binding domain-containing protein n=1 Tax=Bacillus TaxID=1386 RepID=UPI001F55E606|nr:MULTISPECIES: excalibur calcium-binding domain-containing protein [Bacillus]MCI2251072.1 excalibur calcium-binding domain-containing protein [Bacillus cereus]MCQ6293832.1 excalibur calcium-binding domain-containing protein [Bacillus cereus]MCT1381242.1 excalibur calcium-binding domain-containing protein [Bacillus sp. p3-SID196]HDR4640259.1 excalibur calcium-binding domain-containing protein [Bacillus cereus]HDR4646186.1 excalibur calcium-binding domain-containing protein [Bacillus cereus]